MPLQTLSATPLARRGLAVFLWLTIAALHLGLLWTAAAPTRTTDAAEPMAATRTRAPAVQLVATAAPVEAPLPVRAPTRASAKPRPATESFDAPRTRPLRPPEPSPAERAVRLATTSTEAVPRYRTQLPPPLHWRYRMRRGGREGSAELQWSPTADGYRIELLGWASAGAFDSDGLAPERHTESRRGREWRAVNFQRDQGRITFSGSQGEAPLGPGAQDRLSWMLQLSGVLAANPALREAGAEVAMVVAGIRGSAGVWRLQNLGAEALDLPAGRVVGALHLRREAAGPYDLQVDIWLDPARHHGPVRLLMQRPGAAADAAGQVELWLADDAP